MQDMLFLLLSKSSYSRESVLLAPVSPPHYPVSSRIRNRDQVMYYTLKQRPAFRHDSTEGPWVMRQTHTLGTRPDVHTSSAFPVAASVETLQIDRQKWEKGFVQHDVSYNICVFNSLSV